MSKIIINKDTKINEVYKIILDSIGYKKEMNVDKKILFNLYRKINNYCLLLDNNIDLIVIDEVIKNFKNITEIDLKIRLIISKLDRLINDIEFNIYQDNKQVEKQLQC